MAFYLAALPGYSPRISTAETNRAACPTCSAIFGTALAEDMNERQAATPCATVTLATCLDAFKALSDPGRLRVFWLLAHIDARICVTEAMNILGVSQYNASRHLAALKEAGLVRATREGKRVFYKLDPEGCAFGAGILAATRSIPAACFQSDIARCQALLAKRGEEENATAIGGKP